MLTNLGYNHSSKELKKKNCELFSLKLLDFITKSLIRLDKKRISSFSK